MSEVIYTEEDARIDEEEERLHPAHDWTQPTLKLFGDHNERELNLEWLAARKAVDGCALVNGWCWTHETADTMDHHFTTHKGAFND